MRLSIIIPLYNKEKYVGRCLDNLLNQNLSPDEFEIIVVDDGSTDSCGSIAKNYAEKHANVQLITQKNAGPSAARNNGLKAAQGKYVYFLDADDYLAENILDTLITVGEQNKLEILEFKTKEIEDGAPSDFRDSMTQDIPCLATSIVDGKSYIGKYDFRNQAWHYFIKRSFLIDTGILFIPDMRAYEDLIFTASIILRSHRVAQIDLDAHRYVKAEGSIVRSKNPQENLKFIEGMVRGVKELYDLIQNLQNLTHTHISTIGRLKTKQHAIVFALLIRVIKYRLLGKKELAPILEKMKSLGAYPIKLGNEGIGNGNFIKNQIVLPIFNNKSLLYFGNSILRMVPRN